MNARNILFRRSFCFRVGQRWSGAGRRLAGVGYDSLSAGAWHLDVQLLEERLPLRIASICTSSTQSAHQTAADCAQPEIAF